MIRSILAPNASPLTLDGTRTYVVGRERAVVIDPGPAIDAHLDAVAEVIGDGVVVGVLVTHAHPDHGEGAVRLAERLRTRVHGRRAGTLADGDRFETDAGAVVAVATPGHAPDHFAFHWPAEHAIFCGDLMIGGMDTTLVASPEGDLTAYLDSLERVRALSPRIIHPSHGPPFENPTEAIDDYIRHRREREAQVVSALQYGPLEAETLVDVVYGEELHPGLRLLAVRTTRAYLEHLERAGRVRRINGRWAVAAG